MRSKLMLAVAFCATLLPAAAVEAQAVIGRTLSQETREPLPGVIVQLRDSTGAVHRQMESDTAGEFRLRAAQPGTYVLHASTLGYADVASEPLLLEFAGLLHVEVLLDTDAIALDPVNVIAAITMRTGRLAEYFDRSERSVRGGNGRIFNRADLEAADFGEMRHLLVTVPVRRNCPMAYFIDGLPAIAAEMDGIPPDHVEGVEIYTSRAAVPPQYLNRVTCAATLVWMRRDMPGRPFRWLRMAGPRN